MSADRDLKAENEHLRTLLAAARKYVLRDVSQSAAAERIVRQIDEAIASEPKVRP